MPFSMHAGDSLPLRLSVKNPDGTPTDLTGTTVIWTAQESHQRQSVEVTTAAGLTVTNQTGGIVEVKVPKATITYVGTWSHQLEIVDLSGSTTVPFGDFTVLRSHRPST